MPCQSAGADLSDDPQGGAKGQAGTEVPVLCAVRPDLSDGCVGSGLGTGATQPRSARGGWGDDRADRAVRPRRNGISGRNPALVAQQNLPAAGGTTCVHSEGKWKAEAVGHPDGARPGSADGNPVDPGADL